MSKELTLIVDGRVDKLSERIEGLEAKLDRAILASAELGTLAQQATEYAAKLEKRIDALEANLEKAIGLLLRHGDLIGRQACRNDSALQEAADIETRVNELEDDIGARFDALHGLMDKIAHPLAAVALKDPMAAAAILDGS